LLQVDFASAGRTSPLTGALTALTTYVQLAVATVAGGTHAAVTTLAATPQLSAENRLLRDENARLVAENARLSEALSRVPAERDLALAQMRDPGGITATVIGYDPEAMLHVITVDRGAKDGVQRDDGVTSANGVVGRIVEVGPLSSKVLLITDVTSRLPAVVQRGRWWAIATGTQTSLRLQYVSQDAKLKVGDRVVTGEGRSFHAGLPIGRIAHIDPAPAGALDQSATVEPAVEFGSLSRVLIIQK